MILPVRTPTDRSLPPDHQAFVSAEPPTGRVIVIAPTRAACETIELAIGLRLETYLEKHHGPRVRELARAGKGFGIVAGTGTGKTLAIRLIAEELVGGGGTLPLRVGVVNREREATPETPTWNVIIVTTGIARRWFENGDILPHDTLIVDEIHQTSAELELCLALGKRTGCRFIWLSATVDPAFYARYLHSADVLEVQAFDPSKVARVVVENREPLAFLSEPFLLSMEKQERGVGVFLPTRAAVEQAAHHVRTLWPSIHAAHYHGGEPIRAIRPFLEGTEPRPYLLAMTAAGQSALNVQGLDTVVIDDTRFANVVERGRNVLTKLQLLALIIAAVQVLAAVLLISNTIRVAAYSRRRETGIMRLVGASNLYIQLPFLLEGVLAGIVGAAFATGALAAVKVLLIDGQLRPTFTFTAFIGWDDVLATVPWLFLTGVLLAGLASFVTLRRHLRV